MTKSIDDESPEAWSRINKWHRNGPDQHPLFPTKDENMPEAKMTSSYARAKGTSLRLLGVTMMLITLHTMQTKAL